MLSCSTRHSPFGPRPLCGGTAESVVNKLLAQLGRKRLLRERCQRTFNIFAHLIVMSIRRCASGTAIGVGGAALKRHLEKTILRAPAIGIVR
jgi:hypothetical protein